jgi:hypothetical protein
MFPNCPTQPLQKYINLKGLPNKKFSASGLIDTACTIFAIENQSYLGEFEAGARGYCLMKKTEGRKSRDTVPLSDKCYVTRFLIL